VLLIKHVWIHLIGNGRNKIIVIDDDSDIVLFFKTCLSGNGFEADTYTDPTRALSEFKPDYYILALIDIRMPILNGFELSQKFRSLDPKISFCFITAFESYYLALSEAYPDLDTKCFIKKPITCDELLQCIHYHYHLK
jgi:two-component system, OmpR family, response regulator ChvI